MQLNCESFLSSPLRQGPSLQCSFSSVFLFAACSSSARPSNRQYLVCQVSAGEITYLSNSPCKVCVCEDSGRCSVPRSLPAARTIALGRVHRCLTLVMLCSLQKETRECLGLDLKIKLCVSDAGDGAWISKMKLPGASSGRSRGWNLWSQLSPASFIRTLCPGGEKLKHELVSPPGWNFLPGKSVVLPQTGVTAHWIIMGYG